MSTNLDEVRLAMRLVKLSIDGKNTVDDFITSIFLDNNNRLRVICDFDTFPDIDAYLTEARIRRCLFEICNIEHADIAITGSKQKIAPKSAIPPDLSGLFTGIDGVRNVIGIFSGKGGVGKSTVSANLAISLQKLGKNVGIADLDIYGPSIPMLMDVDDAKVITKDGKYLPVKKDNISIMSLGFMLEKFTPSLWRGPMLTKAVCKILRDTAWQNLDFLLIDTPPGTGDVHISLLQKNPIDEAILVSTSHKIAIQNTAKTLIMLKKFGITITGLVRNMMHVDDSSASSDLISSSDLQCLDVPTILDIPFMQNMTDTNLAKAQFEKNDTFSNLAKHLIHRAAKNGN